MLNIWSEALLSGKKPGCSLKKIFLKDEQRKQIMHPPDLQDLRRVTAGTLGAAGCFITAGKNFHIKM